MKVYKKILPKGVKKMFAKSKGVKVKLINLDLTKKSKKNKEKI